MGKIETSYQIHGYLVGEIWVPCEECEKTLSYKFVRKEATRPNPWTDARDSLREALLAATNDHDFRSCRAEGWLQVTRTRRTGTGIHRHERFVDLAKFPSIADMVVAA